MVAVTVHVCVAKMRKGICSVTIKAWPNNVASREIMESVKGRRVVYKRNEDYFSNKTIEDPKAKTTARSEEDRRM